MYKEIIKKLSKKSVLRKLVGKKIKDESEETLHEYIQSKKDKVLDGRLDGVKKSYWSNEGRVEGEWNDSVSFKELKEYHDLLKLRLEVDYIWRNESIKMKTIDDVLLYKWNTHLNGRRMIINQLGKFIRNPKLQLRRVKKSLDILGEKKSQVKNWRKQTIKN